MSHDPFLIHFHDPLLTTEEGIVAVSSELSTANLLAAYRNGIFPWPIHDDLIPWCCPDPRAILDFNDLHVPRRLARFKRNTTWKFTLDQAFREVVVNCSTVVRSGDAGTWITSSMIDAYCELHRQGHAHSVEVWEEDQLVGGLYGVDPGGAFGGESMFSYRSNASKLALLFLIEHLSARGLTWIDIQMLTPHMEALGAKEIDRVEFLARLAAARQQSLNLFGN
jgi:leucyl/phenylalanyl-tRNA---protein transferase